MALSLVYANRTLLVDARVTRYQVQSNQAFEAAEAGVEWMTAMLNDPQRIDEACQPTSLASATNMRHRLLDLDASTGKFVPRTWLDGSVSRVLQPACVRGSDGWRCGCPSNGAARSLLQATSATQPSFLLSLQASDPQGTVQITATGCNDQGADCVADSSEQVEGKAQVTTLLALLPALFTPPIASLTARSDVASPASIGLTNTFVISGGTTVDAGGSFVAPNARLTSTAGAVPSLSIAEGDSTLRELSTDAMFARHFGMDKTTWRSRPGVARLACAASCNEAMAAALATGATLIWIDGDFIADSAATWGSPDQPLIVIATGTIRLSGAFTITGVLYGNGVQWSDVGPGSGSLRGALVSEADYRGDGSPDLNYDPDILKTLNMSTGTFVRVPGSWRDF